MNRSRRCILGVAALCALLSGEFAPGSAEAQHRRNPQGDAAGQSRPDALDPTPEQMRVFLDRQIERTQSQARVLSEAKDMLASGESPQEVRRFLRERHPESREFRRQPVSDEEIMAVLREINPRMHGRLSRLAERSPERFQGQLNRLRGRVVQMAEVRRSDPDRWEIRVRLFQSEQQSRRFARQVADAVDDAGRAVPLVRLRESVSTTATLRQRMHALEIERAEARIDEQRRQLEGRAENQDQWIHSEMERLVKRAAEEELRGDRQPAPRRQRQPHPDL